MKTITLALTMGDPAGIGPEIALKALSSDALDQDCRVFVVGDVSVMNRALDYVSVKRDIYSMLAVEDTHPGSINVLDQNRIGPLDYALGEANSSSGKASYDYVTAAVNLAMGDRVDGIVTNPINKAALRMAGVDYPGHTEILAHQTGAHEFSMMFLLDRVAVVHVTTHCSLREALELVRRERVLSHLRLLNKALVDMGMESPRIAVSGLNPHAGEKGLFGTEEIEEIEPAIEQARAEGMLVTGPLPPDTVFMRAFRGEFDGVVSMLHDHGFVALKSRDFYRGVNVTIGLPIIRTSVGHGTAFEMAGSGAASDQSLIEAINVACRLARSRKERR